MGHARIDDDYVYRSRRVGRAVPLDHVDLGSVFEVRSGRRREIRIVFDGDDMTILANNLLEDRAVIARACTDMEDDVARPYIKLIEQISPEARFAIVEIPRFGDGHEHVVIEPTQIGIGCRIGFAPGRYDPPRASGQKVLPWDGGKGLDNGIISEDGCRTAQFFGVTASKDTNIDIDHLTSDPFLCSIKETRARSGAGNR